MTDKFICADCKGITYGKDKKKSGSGFKWLLFCFTGLYQIPSLKEQKKLKF